jgi:hypothetical protein
MLFDVMISCEYFDNDLIIKNEVIALELCCCIARDGGLNAWQVLYDLRDEGLMPDRSKYDLRDGGLMPWWYHMHVEVV